MLDTPSVPVAAAVRAILVGVSSGAITLAQLNMPSASFWSKWQLSLYLALLALASVTAYELIRVALPSIQAARVQKYEQNLRADLIAGLREVREKFDGTPWEDIGIHAFLIRGSWPLERLVSIGCVRLSATPFMIRPDWRRGKGVIGRAWQDRSFVAVNWRRFYGISARAGRKAWGRRTHRSRYGLSWNELQLTAGYRGIVALPIFDRAAKGRVIGCVAIDGPFALNDLRSEAIRDILERLSISVYLLGEPPRAWWNYRA